MPLCMDSPSLRMVQALWTIRSQMAPDRVGSIQVLVALWRQLSARSKIPLKKAVNQMDPTK